MDKRGKSILSFIMLGILFGSLIIFSVGVVSAAWYDDYEWFMPISDFFGWGSTWQEIFISLFIVLIIVATLYDILGLTAFESKPVKILIGVGIAGIASITNAIRGISTWAFAIAGGITSIGVSVVVIMAVLAFVLIHFGVSKLAKSMIRAKGEIDAERDAAKARKGASTLRGASEGIEKK
ncbi:MAG: hypothetical protein AABW81_03960 [Nanoarchaeota archaeon]